MISRVLSVVRAILIFSFIGIYVLFIVLRGFIFGYDLEWAVRQRQHICSGILFLMGGSVDVRGEVPKKGVFIYVCNHRSYIDPIVTMPYVPFIPVAKMEVASWPLLGYGIKMTGIMYVKREERSSRQATRKAMARLLNEGNSILVYPEGTTHTKPTTIELRPGTFKIAVDNKIPIVPIAINYQNKEIAWVGDDTFIPHLLKILRRQKMLVKLRFGDPIFVDNSEELMQKVKSVIDQNMLEMEKEWN